MLFLLVSVQMKCFLWLFWSNICLHSPFSQKVRSGWAGCIVTPRRSLYGWICTRFSFSNVVIFSFDSCALQRRSWSLRNLCPHRHGFESALQRLQRNWHRGHPWARSRSTGWNGAEPTTIWVLFNGRRRGSPCHPQGLTPAASAESPSSLPTAVDSRLVIEIVMSTVW